MSFLYVASPYTHDDPAVRQLRYEQVMQFVATCAIDGDLVYSPIVHWHPVTQFFDLDEKYEFWLDLNMAMLRVSGGLWVYCLPGWKESKGVQAEVDAAKTMHLPIQYFPQLAR